MDREIEAKIRELFSEPAFSLGRFVLDSGVVSRKLPELISKLETADVSQYKTLLANFAKEAWQGKTITIGLPEFEQYAVPVGKSYVGHIRSNMRRSEMGKEPALTAAIKIAVTIANLDDILIQGEKRGWSATTEHKDDPVRSQEKYVLAKSKRRLSYFGVKPFEAIVMIRKADHAAIDPITVYTQVHEGFSAWKKRKEQFNAAVKYVAGNVSVDAELG